jgi:two-component system NtrC family sensor kinase
LEIKELRSSLRYSIAISLSYDIIKAHGGEIKVVSEEGEGTEFIIQLPIV